MLLTVAITGALIFLALSGMPIFSVIAATALIGFYLSDIEVTVVAIELYRIVDTPMLVALPLFTLAGYLLAESNASHRLVRTAQAAMGWLPGGLGIIALITCAFFTALEPEHSTSLFHLRWVLESRCCFSTRHTRLDVPQHQSATDDGIQIGRFKNQRLYVFAADSE